MEGAGSLIFHLLKNMFDDVKATLSLLEISVRFPETASANEGLHRGVRTMPLTPPQVLGASLAARWPGAPSGSACMVGDAGPVDAARNPAIFWPPKLGIKWHACILPVLETLCHFCSLGLRLVKSSIVFCCAGFSFGRFLQFGTALAACRLTI